MGAEELQAAWELLKEAYQYQMGGDYDMAVELYKRSLDLHPTAEAFTFLGWTYRFQGKIDDAIAECKKAIQIDPELHRYLIGLRRRHPWLHAATTTSLQLANRHYVYATRSGDPASDEVLIVALNIDDEPMKLMLSELGMARAEVIAGSSAPPQEIVSEVVVEAHGWRILRPV